MSSAQSDDPLEAAAPQPDAPPAAEPDALEAELTSARQEAASARDQFLRAVADLENFRKRSLREKDETRHAAAGRVLQDFLPVWDNLALALDAARQPKVDLKTLVSGVDMVLQQFKSALNAHGMAEINPVGQKFDPHQQEAISHEPSATVPAEHVLKVIRSGFLLNGRLLRPASVVVSSGPAQGAASS
jgi:molecular chaperone GrpE